MAELTVEQLNEKLASTTEKLERMESALTQAAGKTSSLGQAFHKLASNLETELLDLPNPCLMVSKVLVYSTV